MRRRTWALLFLAGATAAPLARAGGGAGSPSPRTWEEGSRASAGTWPQEDGSPARTGATETEPLRGALEVAWRFTVAGDVEGEPLAWKGTTFVVERAGAKAILHVLSTATGAERYKQAFDSALPLSPCVGDGRVVLRTSSRTIQGFAVAEKALVPRWAISAKVGIGPPTVVRDEVYAVVDGVLERHTYGTKEVVWPKIGGSPAVRSDGAPTAPAGTLAGKGSASEYPRPSVRGTSVFLAAGPNLVEVDRKDGSPRRKARLDPPADARARVLVGRGDVLVACGKRWKEGDRDVDTFRFGLGDGGAFDARTGLLLPSGIASVGRDWVGVFPTAGTSPVLALLAGSSTDPTGALDLATSAYHSEYLGAKVAPTTAGAVVSVGGRMFDADTLDVVRADGVPCISRTIPLRDRLLVVEAKGRVVAWKSARKAREERPLSLLAADGTTPPDVPPAHAVVEDGRIVAGGFVVDPKAGTLRGTGKPGDAGLWPLASVHALLTDASPRRLLLASRPEDAAEAVAAVARATTGADLVALVSDAVASGDAALARRTWAAAGERGAPEADLARAEKAVSALEGRGGDRVEDKAADVEHRLAALLGREADVLVEAAALPDGAPPAYGTALVRAAVERSPYHAGATEWVRSRLPRGLSPKGFRDLGDWLDFLDIRASTTLRVLGPLEPPAADESPAVTRALAKARSTWRDDLVGFANGPLLVVAPPENPGAIGRCLTVGRLVCDALDAAFASIGPRRADSEVLVLHLFPSRAEYLAHSNDGSDEPGQGWGGLVSTAGHFSPRANVTRIFFPTNDTRDTVSGTYAHELTHHWIARRRPARTAEDAPGDAAGGRGYWIVEGFADFVKGFDIDVTASTAEPENPRAGYADIVAGVPGQDTIPWARLLEMSQSEAYAPIAEEGGTKIPLHWRMGLEGRYSKVHIYYAQAAATTAYLFLAEGGKHRQALLSFLYDHYAGECDPSLLLAATGMSAEELGTRVVKWCRSLVSRPK